MKSQIRGLPRPSKVNLTTPKAEPVRITLDKATRDYIERKLAEKR